VQRNKGPADILKDGSMAFRGSASLVALGLALLLVGCGGGSGRSGTDLVVSGVGPSAQLNGGDPVVFVMTVGNEGEFDATDITVRVATLQMAQPTLSITCTARDGATCPAATGPSMTVPSMTPGGSLVFEVASTANLGASGLVSSTLSVSSGSRDVNTSNNTFTASAPVASNDLVVTGTAPAGPLLSGPATFTMVVDNVGTDAAGDVVLTTTLSASLTLDGPGVVCMPSGGAVAPELQPDGTLRSPSIPVNGRLTCDVNVIVAGNSNGAAAVSMRADAPGDSRTGNNVATASVSTTLSNDVSVVGTAPPGPLLSGSATFLMRVANAGPDQARDVGLVTTVSAALTLDRQDIACAASGGAAAPTMQPDGSLRVSSLPSGAALECSIPVTVAPATSGFAVVSMTAESAGDTRPGNNTGTASVSATLTNDVGVSGSAPPGPLLDGSATFTMVVDNSGVSTAFDVRLTNTVGPNLTLDGAIGCVASGGAVAPALQADGTLLSPSIPPGGRLTCSVPVTVKPGVSATVFNTMAVDALGDVRASNNTATASVSATLVNNLTVAGTADAATVIGGKSTRFEFRVGNTGPSTAFDVVLANRPSANLTASGPISCAASGGAVAPVLTPEGALVSAAIPLNGLLTCGVPLTVAAGANGTVTSTFSATATGDQRPADSSATVSTVAVSSNLGVSQTGAAEVGAGSPTSFRALVSNPGPGPASNLRITWTRSPSSNVTFDPPTCTASAGATCPAVLGPDMTVASLGAGRSLTFTFRATPAASFRGNIVSTVTVASDEDQDSSNNSASATTRSVDPRNGSYSAYAANGRAYTLVVDFDALKYTMSGQGGSVDKTFTGDASTGDFVVSGTARLRTGKDLLVGGHDFGDGVLPFVAAREFTTSLAGLAGNYNLATRNVDSAGVATTRPASALISGNTLSVCQSETNDVVPVRNCSAAARKDYFNLTLDGTVATGVTAGGEAFSFSVASSGAAKVLLSAGAAVDGTEQFRIGLIDSAAGLTFGPPVRGPSSTGDWLRATLTAGTPPSFAAVGVTTSDTVSLLNISNSGAGPFSMLAGTSITYNALVYVLQASPLVVVVGGSPAYAGASSGFLQLGLP
jgi:hypothetical protein